MDSEVATKLADLKTVCTDRLAAIADRSKHRHALVTVNPCLVLALLAASSATGPQIAAIQKGCSAVVDGLPEEKQEIAEVHIAAPDLLLAFAGLPA
jgi:hypothetical protein